MIVIDSNVTIAIFCRDHRGKYSGTTKLNRRLKIGGKTNPGFFNTIIHYNNGGCVRHCNGK